MVEPEKILMRKIKKAARNKFKVSKKQKETKPGVLQNDIGNVYKKHYYEDYNILLFISLFSKNLKSKIYTYQLPICTNVNSRFST